MATKFKNSEMHNAKKNKQDEFYTQLSDIEQELKNYKEHLKGKTIFCNCDDPYESNFFKYFAMNFNQLHLKKLVATAYCGSPIAQRQLKLFDDFDAIPKNRKSAAYVMEVNEVEDYNKDGAINLLDVEYLLQNDNNSKRKLKGDGDFRSDECIDILKQSDIVVTNPPFSLFREYLAQLFEYKKKFLIIGSKNAITYKEVFERIMSGDVWLGGQFPHGNAYFKIPESYEREWADGVFNKDTGLVKFRNVGWFTNLDFEQRHEELSLYKKYSEEEYPKYDNYDAIEVSKVVDIPYNYSGVIGVPITFLDKYCPEQFEILGITDRQNTSGLRTKKYTTQEVPNANDLNARSVIKQKDGTYKAMYARLLIRNKHPEM